MPDGTPDILWFCMARPLAWEVPTGMGQTVLPHLKPLQAISTHGKLSPEQICMA